MTQWNYNSIENLCNELFISHLPVTVLKSYQLLWHKKWISTHFLEFDPRTAHCVFCLFVCFVVSFAFWHWARLDTDYTPLNLYSSYQQMTVKTASSAHASLCTVKVKWGENYQCKFWSTLGFKLNPCISAWGQVVLSVFREWQSPSLPTYSGHKSLLCAMTSLLHSQSSHIFRGKRRKVIKGERIKTIMKPVSRNSSSAVLTECRRHVLLTQNNARYT